MHAPNIGTNKFLDYNQFLPRDGLRLFTSKDYQEDKVLPRQYITMVYILAVYKNANSEELDRINRLLEDKPIGYADLMQGIDPVEEVKWLVDYWLCSQKEERSLFQGKGILSKNGWMAKLYPNTFSDNLEGYRTYLDECAKAFDESQSVRNRLRYEHALHSIYVALKGHQYLMQVLASRTDEHASRALWLLEKRLSPDDTKAGMQQCMQAMFTKLRPEFRGDIDKTDIIETWMLGSCENSKCIQELLSGPKYPARRMRRTITDEFTELLVRVSFAFTIGYVLVEGLKLAVQQTEALPAIQIMPNVCLPADTSPTQTNHSCQFTPWL